MRFTGENTVEMVDIDSLVRHPDNPRQGDIGAITESMRAHGFYGNILVSQKTRHILAGNHRWSAARMLKYTQVPVMWVDVTEAQERRIVLVDNRTNDLASYDEYALSELLQELVGDEEGLIGTGFDAEFLDDLLASLADDIDLGDSLHETRERTIHVTCPNCTHEFTYHPPKKK